MPHSLHTIHWVRYAKHRGGNLRCPKRPNGRPLPYMFQSIKPTCNVFNKWIIYMFIPHSQVYFSRAQLVTDYCTSVHVCGYFSVHYRNFDEEVIKELSRDRLFSVLTGRKIAWFALPVDCCVSYQSPNDDVRTQTRLDHWFVTYFVLLSSIIFKICDVIEAELKYLRLNISSDNISVQYCISILHWRYLPCGLGYTKVTDSIMKFMMIRKYLAH